MRFNIFSYIEGLQRSLEKLRPQGRIAFAVWCADSLCRDVRDYLAAKTDPAQHSAVWEALDYLWKCVSGDKQADATLDHLRRACEGIGWGEEAVGDDEQVIDRYAIEAISSLCCALDTCKTGSALSAAKAAENVINKLDLQLSDELLVDSYSEAIWSDPKWKAELERQQRMLEFLQDSPGLKPEQRRLFRE